MGSLTIFAISFPFTAASFYKNSITYFNFLPVFISHRISCCPVWSRLEAASGPNKEECFATSSHPTYSGSLGSTNLTRKQCQEQYASFPDLAAYRRYDNVTIDAAKQFRPGHIYQQRIFLACLTAWYPRRLLGGKKRASTCSKAGGMRYPPPP